MALLFIDGFDHYTNTTNATMPLGKWDTMANAKVSSGVGRRGSGALVLTGGAYVDKALNLTSTIGVGMAVSISALPASGSRVLLGYLYYGNTIQASLCIDSNGHFEVYYGDANIPAPTSPNASVLAVDTRTAIAVNTFYYLEAMVLFNSTAGYAQACTTPFTTPRSYPSPVYVSGINTVGATVAGCTNVRLMAVLGTVIIDDFYCLDATGTLNNGLLGDSRIDTLAPAKLGTYSNFTPVGAVSNPVTLAGHIPPDPASYMNCLTIGGKETFLMTPLAANTGVISGVQVVSSTQGSAGNTSATQHVVRTSGAIQDATSVSTFVSSAGFKYGASLFPTQPNSTVNWTEMAVNTSEFGIEVVE